MESKKKYIYQLSLADGTILMNECEGFFSVKDPEKQDDKVLINSATLVKILDIEEAPTSEPVVVSSDPLEVELVSPEAE